MLFLLFSNISCVYILTEKLIPYAIYNNDLTWRYVKTISYATETHTVLRHPVHGFLEIFLNLFLLRQCL